MSNINKNRDLIIRRNKGYQIRDPWLVELSQASKVKLAADLLISLEETMVLKDRLNARLKDNKRVSICEWKNLQEDDMYDFLRTSSTGLPDILVYLFSHVDQMIGAIKIPLRTVLSNAKNIWGVVKEDIKILSIDGDSGLCLEKNLYSTEGVYISEGIYLLSSWGILEISKCN